MLKSFKTPRYARLREWTRPIVQFFSWVGQHELPVLVAGLILFGFLFGFVSLASEVMEGDTHAIDEQILLALRNTEDTHDPIGPVWVEEMIRDFTSLGGSGILSLLTMAVIVYLMLQRKFGAMTFVTVAIVGGVFLSLLLKQSFDRPRPDLVPHATYVVNSSFPSGHAMLSAVTFLTLGALLSRIHPRRRFKAFFLLMAALLTLLVGISRVYLGVHWPTDVLGGWVVGAAWATLCWLAARWLQRRGQVEDDIPTSDVQEQM